MVAFTAVVALEPTQVSLPTTTGIQSVELQPGQVHRFDRDDLFIGSSIDTEHPVGVFVGAPIAFMPYYVSSADHIINQVPPLSAWASEYAVVGHPPRKAGFEDSPLYRIVAARDGTTFHYDPTPPMGAPSRLDAGGLAVFRASAPFVVRGQDEEHPFYVSVAMTGSGPLCDIEIEDAEDPDDPPTISHHRCPGDPELVSVTAPSEYARRFAFATEHQFPATYLVLVRRKNDAGFFDDVTLECAGTIEGWTPIGNEGTYETVTVPLAQGEFEPQEYPGGTCELGAHRMWSDGPFTGFVWAWAHEVDGLPPADDGSARSYGFALYGTGVDSTPR